MALSKMNLPLSSNVPSLLDLSPDVRKMIYNHVYEQWDIQYDRCLDWQSQKKKLTIRSVSLGLLLCCFVIIEEVDRFTQLRGLSRLQARVLQITVDDNPPFDWTGLDLDNFPQLATIVVRKDVITEYEGLESDTATNDINDDDIKPILRRRIAAFSTSLPAHNQARFQDLTFVFRTTHFKRDLWNENTDIVQWSKIEYKHENGSLTHKRVEKADFNGRDFSRTEASGEHYTQTLMDWKDIIVECETEDFDWWLPREVVSRSSTTKMRRNYFDMDYVGDDDYPGPFPDETYYDKDYNGPTQWGTWHYPEEDSEDEENEDSEEKDSEEEKETDDEDNTSDDRTSDDNNSIDGDQNNDDDDDDDNNDEEKNEEEQVVEAEEAENENENDGGSEE